MLLSEKNKGLGVNSVRVISLCYSWKGAFLSCQIISGIFLFCRNVDIDKVLLLDKNEGQGVIHLVIFLCNSWKGVWVSVSYLAKQVKDSSYFA